MNKYKIILCSLLLFFDITSTWAQSANSNDIYEGVIISASNNKKLEDVICQTLDVNKNIIAYTFSDSNGAFSLRINQHTQFVQFRLLGYTTLTMSKADLKAQKIIKLTESSIALKEVVVSVPPIQTDGDTLKYNVNSFRGQEDQYVSDILKKLPGIKIAESGTISYMGESINKFYIEGRDLLGGQYNIATNNLDVDAISSIEVLQNNQHIKALKGVSFNEKAAINLKLKKGYQSRPFGEIQAGAGGTPFLYNGKAFATHLGQKTQTLVNLKGLNNGEYLLKELDDKLDMSDVFSFEPLTSPLVNAPSPRWMPLPTSRHLFNKTFLGSANTLIPISKDSELKINIAYGLDKTNQDFNLLQSFATDNDFLQVREQTKQKNKINNARISIAYEHNSMNKYIKNEVVYYSKKEDITSDMRTDNSIEKNTSILGQNNIGYIQNNFQSLFKFKEDKTIQVNSFLRLANQKDELDKSSISKSNIDELFKTKQLINKNQVSTSFNLFKNKLDINFLTYYKQRDFTNHLNYSSLELKSPLEPIQEMTTKFAQFGLEPNYQIKIKNKSTYFTLKLPLFYSSYKAENQNTTKQKDERMLFTPSLSNTWTINHKWESYIKLGYRFDYINDNSLLLSPYFSSYRSIYIPSNTFNYNKNLYAASRIRYKDIVNLFFFNMNIVYRLMKYNYINVFHNTSELSYYTTENQRDKGRLFTITSDISKTFSSCNLTISINPSYTRLKSNIIQQNIKVGNTNHIVSLSAKTEWKGIKNMSFTYKAAGKISWSENNLVNKTSLKSLTQNLGIYYFPTKKLDLALNSDYIIHENKKDNYSKFFFLDLKGTYRHKKMEFGGVLNNLLNKDLYSLTELSSVNTYSQQIPLRKREFLLFIKFKF